EWEATLNAKTKGLPKEIAAIAALAPEKRTPQHKQALRTHFRSTAVALAAPRKQLAELQRQKADLLKAVPTTLVAMSGPPRVMRVLPRGNWLDDSGEIVAPGVPAALPTLAVKDRRATRLDLARWLVADDNPLTARVFVNRLWALLFGQGLVKTLDD